MAILPGDPALYGQAAPVTAPQSPVAAPAAAPLAAPQYQAPGLFQALAPAAIGLLGTAMGGGNTFARGYAGGLNNAARNRRAEYDQQLRRWRMEQAARQSQAQLEQSRARTDILRADSQAKRDALAASREGAMAMIDALPPDQQAAALNLYRADPDAFVSAYGPQAPREFETKLKLAGIDPSTPEGQAMVRDILMKPGVSITQAPTGYATIQQPDGTQALAPIPGGPADPATAAAKKTATEQAEADLWRGRAQTAVLGLEKAYNEVEAAVTSGDFARMERAITAFDTAADAVGSPVLRNRTGGGDPGDTAVNAFRSRSIPSLTAEVVRRGLGGQGEMRSVIEALKQETGADTATDIGTVTSSQGQTVVIPPKPADMTQAEYDEYVRLKKKLGR